MIYGASMIQVTCLSSLPKSERKKKSTTIKKLLVESNAEKISASLHGSQNESELTLFVITLKVTFLSIHEISVFSDFYITFSSPITNTFGQINAHCLLL